MLKAQHQKVVFNVFIAGLVAMGLEPVLSPYVATTGMPVVVWLVSVVVLYRLFRGNQSFLVAALTAVVASWVYQNYVEQSVSASLDTWGLNLSAVFVPLVGSTLLGVWVAGLVRKAK
jgi:hypothetical protein